MSDGSQTIFERVLDTTPNATINRLIFPWNQAKKTHEIKNFHEEFSNGKITQKHIDELIDDLKSSEYWDPELPICTKFIYFLCALGIFAIFTVPA